jgi:1,4-alpha-glucan branching enzyme
MIRKQSVRGSDRLRVTFSLPENHGHGKASVVGDFNGWDPTAHPFVRRSNKTYSVTVELETGRQYAFRYLCEDGCWINDDRADGYIPNGFGTDNSLLTT